MADVVKYGIQIPNRVFVGGVAFDTKEDELKDFFSQYGKVKECKIIKDNQSISRGFAFVTFECKHDAIQTQQLGTVFFNQKKLNLGPAIRQKGVVFNGANEFDNVPVLSTGVYIHPSGYSYTVAPNGVWYFHNEDGSPRARSPGSPSMSYSPTLVHKVQQATQEYQQQATNGSNNGGVHNPPSQPQPQQPQPNEQQQMNCETPPPHAMSVYHNADPVDAYHQTHPQMVQNQTQPATGYVHHTHSTIGSSNIHVAFQNMSISSHPAPPMPAQHLHLATGSPNVHLATGNPNVHLATGSPNVHHNVHPNVHPNHPNVHASVQSPLNNHHPMQTVSSTISHSPVVPQLQYARMGDMYVPYYAQGGVDPIVADTRMANMSSPCHYPVPAAVQQKPEYYTMMPNGAVRDSYMFPVYDPYRPAYVYPQSGYNGGVPVGPESSPCYYKKMYPRYSNRGKNHNAARESSYKKESECA